MTAVDSESTALACVTADYANANPPYTLVQRRIAKRCVSKDEAIEVEIALAVFLVALAPASARGLMK
jgi:hypothetical protein